MKLHVVLVIAVVAATASTAELHVPQQYASIQAAIDASADGDVVVVGAGTYRDPVNLRGRKITLRSAFGPADTVFDGSNYETSILTARSGETLATRVEGFTFRRGFGTTTRECNLGGRKGGAIFTLNSGVSIVDCVFEDNGAYDEGYGGAIFACAADVAIAGSRFDRNVSAHGGAIDYLGVSTRRLTVERSTFRENAASFGGAIKATLFQNSRLTVAGSSFDRNDGGGGGGATMVNALDAARLTITDSSFTGNQSSHGGAVHATFTGNTHARLADCQFEGGRASFGGGVVVNASEVALVELTACDFRGHEASFGGGLFATARGTPDVLPGGRIRVNGCRFFDNVAHACCNTGIIISQCDVDGPLPQGNGLYFGGGADLRTITGGSVTVTNSLFAGNSAPRGGAVHAGSCAGGTIDLVNCTIVGNSSGVQIRLRSPKLTGSSGISAVTLTNSIVRENGGGQVDIEHEYPPSTARVTFNDIEGGFAGAGNIDIPPSFVDPAARDYRLANGSAGIDAGDNRAVDAAILADLAGRPRLADDPRTPDRGTGNSPQVDLGAYEFHAPPLPRRRPVGH